MREIRVEYPIELALKYGTILYDRDNKLQEVQDKLRQDDSLDCLFEYYQDICEITPPIQYKKTKTQK